MLEDIRLATGGRGVYVYDRGGDWPAFYDWFLANGLGFVVRKSPRLLESWRGTRDSRSCLAARRAQETIRFVKLAYRLEDVRVTGYTSLRDMAAVMLATAWLGRRIRADSTWTAYRNTRSTYRCELCPLSIGRSQFSLPKNGETPATRRVAPGRRTPRPTCHMPS